MQGKRNETKFKRVLCAALAVLSVSSFFFRAAKKRLKARAVNDNDKV